MILFFFSFSFFFCPHHAAYRILVLWPGIEPRPSVVEMWSPNYWTARWFPRILFCSIFFHNQLILDPTKLKKNSEVPPDFWAYPKPTSIYSDRFFTGMRCPLGLVRERPPTVPLTSKWPRAGKGLLGKLIIWNQEQRALAKAPKGWKITRPLCEGKGFLRWVGSWPLPCGVNEGAPFLAAAIFPDVCVCVCVSDLQGCDLRNLGLETWSYLLQLSNYWTMNSVTLSSSRGTRFLRERHLSASLEAQGAESQMCPNLGRKQPWVYFCLLMEWSLKSFISKD